MRPIAALVFAALSLPTVAVAQSPGIAAGLPLIVDMKKVEVGAWADYTMTMGEMKLSSRWALVARDAKSSTLEMSTKGTPMAKPVILHMVQAADPTSDPKPQKPMVMQFGDDAPMFVPPDTPTQRFQRPDEKNLVGKEEVKVAAGTFKTAHYREKNAMGTIDVWISESVPPLGLVKVITTPEVDKSAQSGMQVPTAIMELAATGTGAKPAVTKKPKPFDPKKMTGLVGGGP